MPDFPDPFSGKIPDRKLTKGELVRALRLNLAAEHEAIHLYAEDELRAEGAEEVEEMRAELAEAHPPEEDE